LTFPRKRRWTLTVKARMLRVIMWVFGVEVAFMSYV